MPDDAANDACVMTLSFEIPTTTAPAFLYAAAAAENACPSRVQPGVLSFG
jgi:hypothetical protein